MFAFLKTLFAKRPKSRYPHIDRMTSAQLSAFLADDDTTIDEFEYAIKRRGWLARH